MDSRGAPVLFLFASPLARTKSARIFPLRIHAGARFM
jgi:hypothetical protein